MRDTLIAVRPEENEDVHRAVYSSLVTTGQARDFIYSRVPIPSKGGGVIVAVRRPGVQIQIGTYAFSLTASVQVTVSRNVKRTPNDLGAAEWLKRQFAENGAEGLSVLPIGRGAHTTNSGKRIPYIEFGGSVKVIDSDLFSAWYTRGAGKARAYGYGMINLSQLLETSE